MKPLNFKVEVNDEVLKERNKCIEMLKKDEYLLELCAKSNIDTSLIEKYPYRFLKWINGIKLCGNCMGLSECKQENIGKVYHLKYDGYLDFVLQSCRYTRTKQKELAHLKSFAINDMPSTLNNVSIGQLETNALNGIAISEVDYWLQSPNEIGFYLHGKMGVGKSTLAACACNELARENKWVAFVNVPDFVMRMKSLFNSPEEYQKQIRICQNVDFLVLDDIGAESVTAWVRDELLFPILNKRMDEKKFTWFTSNEDLDSLLEHYSFSSKFGEEKMKAVRIMERIKTLSKMHIIGGENRRV